MFLRGIEAPGRHGVFGAERREGERFIVDVDWWLGAWSPFAIVLFIGEPFGLPRFFPGWARRDPERAFTVPHLVHMVLLPLSR